MRRHRIRSAHGQASIEWIVVVGVVSLALAVAGAASGAPQIAGVVARQFRRALCIVSRGDCNEDRVPCTTRSNTNIEDSSVNLGLIKISDTTTLLVERRSDGTWRVTRTHDSGGGLEAGFGDDLSFSALGLKLAVGGEARASVLAHAGHGETWLAHSRAEAQTLGHELWFDKHPPGEPAQRFRQHGTLVTVGGAITIPQGTLSVQLGHDDIDGTRTDTVTQKTTMYLRSRLDPDVSLRLGRTLAGVSLSGMKSTDYALTTDRTGRPIDLAIVSVGRLAGGLGLPAVAKLPARLNARAAEGAAWESEMHLDLTDPDNLAAATAVMRVLKDPGGLAAMTVAARALAARLVVAGTDQFRVYDLNQDSDGVSAHVGGILKFGGSYRESSTSLKLLDAQVRGPEGIWTDRDDCVRPA